MGSNAGSTNITPTLEGGKRPYDTTATRASDYNCPAALPRVLNTWFSTLDERLLLPFYLHFCYDFLRPNERCPFAKFSTLLAELQKTLSTCTIF